jgi:hypothetical protein
MKHYETKNVLPIQSRIPYFPSRACLLISFAERRSSVLSL